MLQVQGLEGVKYQDNLQQRRECAGSDAAIQVDREVDRIYLQTPSKLQVSAGLHEHAVARLQAGVSTSAACYFGPRGWLSPALLS